MDQKHNEITNASDPLSQLIGSPQSTAFAIASSPGRINKNSITPKVMSSTVSSSSSPIRTSRRVPEHYTIQTCGGFNNTNLGTTCSKPATTEAAQAQIGAMS